MDLSIRIILTGLLILGQEMTLLMDMQLEVIGGMSQIIGYS